ncbi:MAG: hypothetical protein ACK4UJ_01700 [Leptonema sp. (in: bacteria)]
MWKYFSFLLGLFVSCSSLQQVTIDKEENFLPKFLSDPEDYNYQIDTVQFFDEFKKKSTESLKDKIVVYNHGIQYEGKLESQIKHLPFLKRSFEIFIENLFSQIKKNYPYIDFVKENSSATHSLFLKIVEIPKEEGPVSFQIQLQIQRIAFPEIQYNFFISPVHLRTLNKEKRVYIIPTKNSIEWIRPEEVLFIETPNQIIQSILQDFNKIGKGEVWITSSSKDNIQVLKSEKKIWEGESPIQLSLWEGDYTLLAKRRGQNLQTISFSIKENSAQTVPIKWKDEVSLSYINVFSNQNIRVAIDNEFKSFVPVFTSELSRGNYTIELSKKRGEEYQVLYSGELELKENHYINLFYPIDYIQDFSKLSFVEHTKKMFWFFNKKNSVLKEEHFSDDFFSFPSQVELFTPNIILDDARGEFLLSCIACEVTFYFEKDFKILVKKEKDLISIYSGTNPLEFNQAYLVKEKELFFYWDYSNSDSLYSLYINSSLISKIQIPSVYVVLKFTNLQDMKIKDFKVSEKERLNLLLRNLYFLKRKLESRG